MSYTVEVLKSDTGEVVKRIECDTARKAEKVDAGLNINLNQCEYYTRIVESEKTK